MAHCVEDRLRQRVLHEHVRSLLLADRRVQVLAQGVEELQEAVALRAGRGDDLLHALRVAGGDPGDLLSPERPIAARADLLDHLRVDLRAEVELVLGGGCGRRGLRPSRFAHADHVDDDLAGAVFVEVDLVDLGVEVVVVGAEGVEDGPDDVVHVGIVEGVLGRHVGRDDDGNDDVAVFLAGSLAHHAADGLDDVHHAVLGGEEEDRVEARHVHALGEAFHVGEDVAGVRPGGG